LGLPSAAPDLEKTRAARVDLRTLLAGTSCERLVSDAQGECTTGFAAIEGGVQKYCRRSTCAKRNGVRAASAAKLDRGWSGLSKNDLVDVRMSIGRWSTLP
jgi:hypothetical protein